MLNLVNHQLPYQEVKHNDKISSELGKKLTGKTFYIMDEPTTGLHHEDINLLLDVIRKLIRFGNTILVIEHNLDVILQADHIIDLGPEGGNKGGEVIFEGTVKDLVKIKVILENS